MADLLQTALDAHGGIDRWRQLRRVKADLSIGGVIWPMKGKPDILKRASIEGLLHEQKLTTHLLGQNKRFVFLPNRVLLETEDGALLQSRESPRASFDGVTADSPWDDLHVAYFSSYALWTYLTIPFLYTWPGFATEELQPWEEDGEVWRPLRVKFPSTVASHTAEQTSYFGADGLLRRHQYTVDVLGGAPGVNYAALYHNSNGIIVPTMRRVHAYDADKKKVPEPVLVSIDIEQIAFD